MYFILLRLLLRLFGIIHVKCQSRCATTADLNGWIQELASASTSDLNTFGKQLFAESKVQAVDVKINLPVVSRIRRTIADDEVKEFYVTLCEKVCQAAANSLLRRYQSRPLEISNFLRCLLEDETLSRNDIEAVSFMLIGILRILCVNVSSYLLG